MDIRCRLYKSYLWLMVYRVGFMVPKWFMVHIYRLYIKIDYGI